MDSVNNCVKTKKRNERYKKELLFYSLMMIFPVIQVLIFYFAVNFNSILLAFKEYSYGIGEEIAGYSFAGFDVNPKV